MKDLGSLTKEFEAFLMYASPISESFRVHVRNQIPELPNTHTGPESDSDLSSKHVYLAQLLSDNMQFIHHFQI